MYPDRLEGKTWVNNHAHVLKPKSELTDHDYLLSFLNYRRYENHLTFTAQPKLTQREMAKALVILPPIDEQRNIASILKSIEIQFLRNQEIRSRLVHLEKGLMQKLLTGQIRVKV